MKDKIIKVIGIFCIAMIFVAMVITRFSKPLGKDIDIVEHYESQTQNELPSKLTESQIIGTYVKIQKDNIGNMRYDVQEDYINQKLILTIYSSNEKYCSSAQVIEGYEGSDRYNKLLESSNFMYFYDQEQDAFVTQIHMILNSVYAYELKQDEDYFYLVLQEPKEVYEKIIVIDAGHGGTDGGAPGYDAITNEKDINLNILLQLKKIFDNEEIKVYYTRVADDAVYLKQRAQLANMVEADLFISIHCNSNDSDEPKGTEILYNGSFEYEGFGSLELSQYCLDEITKALGLVNRGLVESSEDVYIIGESKVPIALVEVGFISNKDDFAAIIEEKNQEKVAKAIYDVVHKFYRLDK